MKMMSEWFEEVIENLDGNKSKSSIFLVVLLVLIIGAGSLYMLLNSPS